MNTGIGTGSGTDLGIRWTYAFIDRPAGPLRPAQAFWTAVTATRLSGTRGEQGEFVTLLPGEGDACVKVQGVDSAEGGAHLDFAVEDVDGFVEPATALGAAVVDAHTGWAVLRSPAGQLFCAVPWHGEAVRPAVVDGSRLDQVAIDIPSTAYATEVAFWERLTAWDSLTGSLPEFHVLRPPAGLPIRILLHRLGTERPAASAHLDLACADIGETRARHERLGATAVARFPHWTVMRDPAGGTYCLTGRDPETGGLPTPKPKPTDDPV